VGAADVHVLCGPRDKHDADRTAIRHGSEAGSVTLGGRLPVRRPRVRASDGSRELPIASYEAFSSTELLGRKAISLKPFQTRGPSDGVTLLRSMIETWSMAIRWVGCWLAICDQPSAATIPAVASAAVRPAG
jgi:hypothetical protein